MKIIRADGYDVVIVSKLACMGAESKVGGLREFKGLSLEAFGPFIFGFVLEFDFE